MKIKNGFKQLLLASVFLGISLNSSHMIQAETLNELQTEGIELLMENEEMIPDDEVPEETPLLSADEVVEDEFYPEEATESTSELVDDITDDLQIEEIVEDDELLAANSGTCGDNLTWSLTGTVLTISGSGAMKDYYITTDYYTGQVISGENPPWRDLYFTELVIKDGVTVIGGCAFADCTYLTKVTMADSVTEIKSDAFADDRGITQMNISRNLVTLGSSALYYVNITELTLPKTLTNMTPSSFSGLYSVQSYSVESGNPRYQSVDGVIFSADGKQLIAFPQARTGRYDIPYGVTDIKEDAFVYSSASEVTIPNTVTTIEGGAFWYASIEKMEIPASVTSVGKLAFYGCTGDFSLAPGSPLDDSVLGDVANNITAYIDVYDNYDMAYQVLNLVNTERQAAGLAPLIMDASLLKTAMLRAAETVLKYDHTRPNGQLCFSANSAMIAENVAGNFASAQNVMSAWMTSEGHKANILSTSASTIGIGCVQYNGANYWVQCFGASGSEAAKPANAWVTESIQVKAIAEYAKPTLSCRTDMNIGDSQELQLKISDYIIPLSECTFTSSNSSVVSVTNGKCTAKNAGTATITGAWDKYNKPVTAAITVSDTEEDDGEMIFPEFLKLKARATSATKNSITIKWQKVPGAVNYDVLFGKAWKGTQSKGKTTGTSFKVKKLKKGTYYEFIIVALDQSGEIVTYSPLMFEKTKGGSKGNPSSVKLNKKKITLKRKKTFKLTSKVKVSGGKSYKVYWKVQYESSNPSVATVSSSGKIKAKKKGTCYVYAYAQNGAYARIKVKVK